VWLSWPCCSWWQEVHGRLALLDALAADWELRTGRCVGRCRRGRPWAGSNEDGAARRRKRDQGQGKGWGRRWQQHHWSVVVDHDGTVLLSRRLANDEQAILELLAVAGELADEMVWAVDLARGYSALLLALLWDHRQQVVYVPGPCGQPRQ
jgi:hypothetical protein